MSQPNEDATSRVFPMPTGKGTIPMSACWPPGVQLAARLFYTEYEYGQLHLCENHGRHGESEGPVGGRVREISLVMHPRRGMAIAGSLYAERADHATALQLEEEYARLMTLEQMLRRKLRSTRYDGRDEHRYWSGRPLAMGPVVLVFGAAEPADFETAIEEHVLVGVDDWRSVPDEIGAAMAAYNERAGGDYEAYGAQMTAQFRSLRGPVSGFIDHVTALDGFDEIAEPLFAL